MASDVPAVGGMGKHSIGILAVLFGLADCGSAMIAGQGDLRESCRPDRTCNSNLTCISDICVDVDAGTSSSDGSGTGGTGGFPGIGGISGLAGTGGTGIGGGGGGPQLGSGGAGGLAAAGGLDARGGSSNSGGAGGGCQTGYETCPCYGNNTCQPGLTCASHLCVNLGTGGAGGMGARGTGGMGGVGGA